MCPQQVPLSWAVLLGQQRAPSLLGGGTMSAAQMQKEAPEVGWPGLEALGLSPRELVLAEALQMEYDALSRLRQDKSEAETVHSPSCSSHPSPAGEPRSAPGGPSGSGPSPGRLGGPDSPPSIPPRVPPPRGDHTQQSLFILDASEDNKLKDPAGPGSKCLNPLSDETPPALPPRVPISQSETPVPPSQEPPAPHNVNLFLPEVEQPKEATYDSINRALVRLNSSQGARGRPSRGEPSGKPVSRSKTLPPQLPPRTNVPALKRHNNPQRGPADLVRAWRAQLTPAC